MTTGRDLKEKRLLMGLSQAAMGTALGVTSTTISTWERGDTHYLLRRKHEIRLIEIACVFERKMADSTAKVRGYQRMSMDEWESRKAEKLRRLQKMYAENAAAQQEQEALPVPLPAPPLSPEEAEKARKAAIVEMYAEMGEPVPEEFR